MILMNLVNIEVVRKKPLVYEKGEDVEEME
jgi:hypothetical protein